MASTRRRFLQETGSFALSLPLWAHAQAPPATTLDPRRLARYVQPLPLPPRARALPGAGVRRFRLRMLEAHLQLHPDLPPTRCWTFEGTMPGPLLEAQSGEAVEVEWVNSLPARHFLPVDHTLPGNSRSLPPVRTVIHLHGARVPAASDGYPDDWIVPGQTQHCRYPNPQAAAALFYHDHAMGLSYLSMYAGLFGLYWLRDAAEAALPLPRGEHEVPLVFCDRWLDSRGQLYYPTSGDPRAPWVPEVEGNAMLVNGALWPELEVEPRCYRLRTVNVANGRFFRLALAPAVPLWLIGTGQGLLPTPVRLSQWALAPAERGDLVVDFRPAAGGRVALLNDGEPIMRFRVRAPTYHLGEPEPPARLVPLRRLPEASATRVRRLSLREYDAPDGQPRLMLLDGKTWGDAVSEQPRLGATEIWEFVNPSDDTHPIHLHMVRFQVLGRQGFDVDQYLAEGRVRLIGPAESPGADEMGWKDTVRCYPGVITRVIIPFEGFAGRYVWHCHILEHQANQMMRPYEIRPAAPAAAP